LWARNCNSDSAASLTLRGARTRLSAANCERWPAREKELLWLWTLLPRPLDRLPRLAWALGPVVAMGLLIFLLRGADLATLIGRTFTLGDVSFAGTGEARPCHWMNHAVAPGAEEWLKGRGGLRARILTDGELALGATELMLAEKISQPDHAARFIRERTVELRFEGGV
jgi:hypothetical protein